MVGEAMEQFTMQGMDHMEWDEGSDQFIKTSPQDPPLMEVQVKVLSQVQKKFLRRKARLWTLLGRSKQGRERGLADTWAMVCTAGQDTVRAMWLQVDMLAKTKMVVRRVKAHSVGGSGGGDISRGQNIIPDFGCHRGNS